MSNDAEAQERVKDLIDSSARLVIKGDVAQAAQSLREASNISPHDTAVRSAWERVKETDSDKNLHDICREYLYDAENELLGKKAVRGAAKEGLSKEEVEKCLELYINSSRRPPLGDRIIGKLLAGVDGQLWLASQYQHDENEVFEILWIQGDETIYGFVTTLLNSAAWKSEDDRLSAERGGFTLLLSKLFSPGEDNVEVAMRAIARLLAVDAPKLQDIIDADGLSIILHALDMDSPPPLRSQATLATAKFLQASSQRGQNMLADFMVSQIAKKTNDDLVIAFSAAAAIFPVAPSIAATMFLTEGFILELAGFANKTRSTRVRHAMLELLSAACIEKTCRESVTKHFTRWLREYLANGKNKDDLVLAALVLSKTGDHMSSQAGSAVHSEQDRPNLVVLFKNMLLKAEDQDMHNAIEGLAYVSIQPQVKENLSNDGDFLKNFFKKLEATPSGDASLFGGMNIIFNVTTYNPRLSTEEKRIDDLKAYANATKPGKADPLNDDTHVTARCDKMLEAGVVPLLVKIGKKTTPSVLALIAKIMLSLTFDLKHCGRMIQEGAYDHSYRSAIFGAPKTDPLLLRVKHDSAHALARLLIPTDPSLIFTQTRSTNDAVRALSPLLLPPEDLPAELEGRDTLARSLYTLHALRGLTNIASFDDKACDAITSTCFPQIEAALWSDSTSERDAAVELICNIVQRSGLAISQFAPPDGGDPAVDSGKAASTRFQILWACVDAERAQTRYAALAAVGTLLQFPQIAGVFLGLKGRSAEVLLEYVKEDNAQIRILALVALGELLGVENQGDAEAKKIAELAGRRLKDVNVVEVLKGLKGLPEDQKMMVGACLKALRE